MIYSVRGSIWACRCFLLFCVLFVCSVPARVARKKQNDCQSRSEVTRAVAGRRPRRWFWNSRYLRWLISVHQPCRREPRPCARNEISAALTYSERTACRSWAALSEHWEISAGRTGWYRRNAERNVWLLCISPDIFFFVFFPLFQYIFSCLRNGDNPFLIMVHHSTIGKYQTEQGAMSTQVFKSRSLSRPPPLPLKKVRGQPAGDVLHEQSSAPRVLGNTSPGGTPTVWREKYVTRGVKRMIRWDAMRSSWNSF